MIRLDVGQPRMVQQHVLMQRVALVAQSGSITPKRVWALGGGAGDSSTKFAGQSELTAHAVAL